jgi:hypothetical protein
MPKYDPYPILLALIASPRPYTEFDQEGNNRILVSFPLGHDPGPKWEGWNSPVQVARNLAMELNSDV